MKLNCHGYSLRWLKGNFAIGLFFSSNEKNMINSCNQNVRMFEEQDESIIDSVDRWLMKKRTVQKHAHAIDDISLNQDSS